MALVSLQRLDALKAWRKNLAIQCGFDSELICRQHALDSIATANPDDLAALEALHVLDSYQVTQYGKAIIAALAAR